MRLRVPCSLLDCPEHAGCFVVVDLCALFAHFLQHASEVGRKAESDRRFRCMLVDHTARRRFKRRRQCPRGVRDVVIVQSCEPFRYVARDCGLDQEEELMLPLGQLLDRRHQHRHIAFLLTLHHRRRVFSRRREMRAVSRAVDLHQTLRRAADRTNRLCQRRTLASRLALITDWTCHAPASHTSPRVGNARRRVRSRAICPYNPAEIITDSSEYGLQPAVVRTESRRNAE